MALLHAWGDRVWSADHNAWDYRLDGTDTSDEWNYGLETLWEHSINDVEIIMRAQLRDAIRVANGTRTMSRTYSWLARASAPGNIGNTVRRGSAA
jgi:hypothetical protein